MKNEKQIYYNISLKRFKRRLISKTKSKNRRKNIYNNFIKLKNLHLQNGSDYTSEQFVPSNLLYLLNCVEGDFHIDKLTTNIQINDGTFKVPKQFSLVDAPSESYEFIRNVLSALILQQHPIINIDYSDCKNLDLSAQVFLDILLKDIIKYFKRCSSYKKIRSKVKQINGIKVLDENVHKLLFSVGSPVIHSNKQINYPDIIPYKLCVHNRDENGDPLKIREQKDIDTTKLVDYVIESLRTLNRTLTPEKLDDLSTVIGEILINAEEHSTTKHRFSIGYFHEINDNGKHYGVFRLTILNFGKTIYEKFKDPNCPNKEIVQKMKLLSDSYKKKNFFVFKRFEEETLWTLYALQDGVTSIAPERYKKRGNGSIQFMESFFNIKGSNTGLDDFSTMSILSGNTSICFDGSYKIVTRKLDGEDYKLMTFNSSGKIEDKPDPKFVSFVNNYFPGTLISAKIMFNEDDLN